MSSIDDCSVISGISSISRISKASSTLLRTDSISNILDFRGSFQKTDGKKYSETALLYKSLSSCEELTYEYGKLVIILNCLKKMVNDEQSILDSCVQSKLKKHLMVNNVKKYIHLPNNLKDISDELALLGIIDFPNSEFSYVEQLSIKSCLEAKLRDEIHNFIAVYERCNGVTKDLLKNNESKLKNRLLQKGELENVHWKDKINEIYGEYFKDLNNYKDMVIKWSNLKERVNIQVQKDTEHLRLRAEITELKATLAKLECTCHMYKETPITFEAFVLLNDHIDEKLSTINQEITEKINLKKTYEKLSSIEYNEILKKYLEYCDVIQKKKSFLEKLS